MGLQVVVDNHIIDDSLLQRGWDGSARAANCQRAVMQSLFLATLRKDAKTSVACGLRCTSPRFGAPTGAFPWTAVNHRSEGAQGSLGTSILFFLEGTRVRVRCVHMWTQACMDQAAKAKHLHDKKITPLLTLTPATISSKQQATRRWVKLQTSIYRPQTCVVALPAHS